MRRGAARQVARASGEGASPAPSPAIHRSESGPRASQAGTVPCPREARPGGRPGASDRPRATCRGGAVPERSRGETPVCAAVQEKRRGRPSSEAQGAGESQSTNRSLLPFHEELSGALSPVLSQSQQGRSTGLMCPSIALALEGAGRSCAEPDGNRSGQDLQEESLGLTSGRTAAAAPPAAGLPGSRCTVTSSPARQLPPGSSEGWLLPGVGCTLGSGEWPPSARPTAVRRDGTAGHHHPREVVIPWRVTEGGS